MLVSRKPLDSNFAIASDQLSYLPESCLRQAGDAWVLVLVLLTTTHETQNKFIILPLKLPFAVSQAQWVLLLSAVKAAHYKVILIRPPRAYNVVGIEYNCQPSAVSKMTLGSSRNSSPHACMTTYVWATWPPDQYTAFCLGVPKTYLLLSKLRFASMASWDAAG